MSPAPDTEPGDTAPSPSDAPNGSAADRAGAGPDRAGATPDRAGATGDKPRHRIVLVTGLSGAGKFSILRALEDLGYEAVDNPPLDLIEELATARQGVGQRPLAVGVDTRSRGFDTPAILALLERLRANPALRAELVYAWATEAVLLRRYTETRRRHPMAPQGRVVDGIAAEQALTAPLRDAADMVVDTSDLPLPELRRRIEQQFGGRAGSEGMTVSLVSFAYPFGLPREADLVLDARFLRNPHYDPQLRPMTGLQPAVAAYVEADPDFQPFFTKLCDLLALVLPRFVQEGKKYATIAIGCTGGRHRSVHLVEKLAAFLSDPAGGGWRVTRTHRELARRAASEHIPALPAGMESLAGPATGRLAGAYPVQAQEA